jgi:hypothetical protein
MTRSQARSIRRPVCCVSCVSERWTRYANAKGCAMTDRREDAGSGVLSRNDRREKPSHPEFKGEATIDGKSFWVAAWVKEKNDKKFFSLAFRPKEEPAKPKPPPAGRGSFDKPIDTEIPF